MTTRKGIIFALAMLLALGACGGEKDASESGGASGKVPWNDIPTYKGAKSEGSEDCPVQWSSCERCEHRVWVTEDDPEKVCAFYEKGMMSWDKLTYQYFPEAACAGTWMADMGSSAGPRMILTVGRTARGDEETQIGILMGSGCP